MIRPALGKVTRAPLAGPCSRMVASIVGQPTSAGKGSDEHAYVAFHSFATLSLALITELEAA